MLQAKRLEHGFGDELPKELLSEGGEVDIRWKLEVTGRVVGAAVSNDALPRRGETEISHAVDACTTDSYVLPAQASPSIDRRRAARAPRPL